MAARRPPPAARENRYHTEGTRKTQFSEMELETRKRLQRSSLNPPRPCRADVLVVAIDFGTTYSGYAFSFKTDFDPDPLEVSRLSVEVKNDSRHSMAHRVPTSILFNPDRKFASFGLEAEDQYARLINEDRTEASKWFFFDRFKMELHRQAHLTRDLTIMDKTKKKSMRGLDIFSEAIRYLKEHAGHSLQERRILVKEHEIKWVLTVPAIWTDGSRQFMREAATLAGIADDRLVLALEPEAASVYCLRYFQSQSSGVTGFTGFTSEDKRFMTVDSGGGTVDISVFEVGPGGNLKQLHRPEGAPCGGVKVDDSFKAFLNEVLGFDGVAAIDSTEMLDLMRKFEMAKPQTGLSDKLAIQVPTTLQENLSVCLQDPKYKGEVSCARNRLLVKKSIALKFYDESKTGIMETMRRVLQSVDGVDAILLVGGLSESKVIQDAVTSAFPEERVLVPPSPSLTVVIGAVQYGHCPQVISTRVAPFTYGVNTHHDFIEGEDDESKAVDMEGIKKCKDVFKVFIRINDIVSLDQQLPFKNFAPGLTGQTGADFTIYRTKNPDPKYVTEEGCEKIGHFMVEMPDLTGEKEREVQVTMCVSGTELRVLASDGNTEKEFSTTCDFLSY